RRRYLRRRGSTNPRCRRSPSQMGSAHDSGSQISDVDCLTRLDNFRCATAGLEKSVTQEPSGSYQNFRKGSYQNFRNPQHRLARRPTRESAEPYVQAFQQGLRDLGWVEGQNIVIEWRYAGG